MENDDLITRAAGVLNRHTDSHGRLHGDVGAAVQGRNGKIYTGVCVDTASWGLCAERSALAAMITDSEYDFEKIVAVWRDDVGKLYVLPPCGHCRQFMRDIGEANMTAEILLGRDKSEPLRNLIPHHEWPEAIE
jgi:cytidine deaminase